jgi:hypothetical protein
MSSTAVRSAFETTLALAMPTWTVLSIENENPVPPKDGDGRLMPFLGTLYYASESALGVGGGCFRERGTINVVIYSLAGRGSSAATEAADDIRDLFGGRDLPVTAPGVRLTLLTADPLTPYLGRAGVPTGAYYVGMVGIAYEYDFIRY